MATTEITPRDGLSQTRVWDVMEREGYRSLRKLARAMGVSVQYLSTIRRGERPIGAAFIRGARRAFPEYPLDYLFPADEMTDEAVPA